MIARTNQKGSILIGIIAAMVLFAALGAAILSLTSTATMNQVMANSSARAYYLAESGLRYAYNPGDEAAFIEGRLEGLHGETFSLAGNDGRFKLEVYPYYLKVTENPQGGSHLQTKFPGGGQDIGDASGWLQIRSKSYNYDARIYYTFVTFQNFDPNLPYIPVGTDVFFIALANGDQENVPMGGDIDLKPDAGEVFPERNGIVEIDGHIYSYREYDSVNHKLTSIKNHDDPPVGQVTVADGQEIVLQKFVKIESTGRFGEGNLLTERKVVYYVPFPIRDRGKKVDFHEKFDDETSLSHWDTTVLGTHGVEDGALKVTGTDSVGTSDSGSLAVFKWPDTVIDLKSSYKQAGNYLSYDAQVKITAAEEPYMAGISFRIADGDDPDSYGISFVKTDRVNDGIPDDLVPPSAILPAIVLWEKSDDHPDRKWLAYKNISLDEISSATILVRIIEAASIKFTGGGPVPVKAGDIVIGQTSGAKGKVVGFPILDDDGDDWAGNNAAGRILLNNITGTFTSGETVHIVGSETTVTVDAYYERDNYIRAYYGTALDIGVASDNPLDDEQKAVLPGAIYWPPDNTDDWSEEVDYFTLIRWNNNFDASSVDRLGMAGSNEEDAIIRTNSLVTDSFSTNIPEIGLHTFGSNPNSKFFDDFAMQAVIQADPIILPPVQE